MTQQGSELPVGLSAPALRALNGAGYKRLDQLTRVSEAELKKLHGLGPRGIDLLRIALNTKGLSFAESKSSKG